MAAPDRLEQLLAQNVVTGLDFVYVHPDQITLDVFFLRPPATLAVPLVNDVTASQLRIHSPAGGEKHPEVPIAGVAWAVADGRDVLRITTAFPGDFSLYRLFIDDDRIDPYSNDITFSFKADCPSDLDCKAPPHECPPETAVDFPVDYLARDFWSFRRALLDYAAQRYPDWKDRLEADLGVLLAELMSATGDELAYYQDRIGREAYLETASQRRSLRRHARLVDHDLDDGRGASTWLDVTVDPASAAGVIPAGTEVWELQAALQGKPAAERRAQSRIVFEIGPALRDRDGPFLQGAVAAARNEFLPHLWDEDDTCLPVGSTTLYLAGQHKAELPFDDLPDDRPPGKWVLLKTSPATAAVAAHAWMVRLVEIEDALDPVFNQAVTRLRWEEAQATPFELDLEALVVRGNLLPATAGETLRKQFRIGPAQAPTDPEEALEREGPADPERCRSASSSTAGCIAYLCTLPGSDERGLIWLDDSRSKPAPEVRLFEVTQVGNTFVAGLEWDWKLKFLGVNSSEPPDSHFTLEDGSWRRVAGFQRTSGEIVHRDYASNAGVTIRFGDGEFGRVPALDTKFEAIYRLGNGRRGNVSAGSLTDFDASALTFVAGLTNPLPAAGGRDPETSEDVRRVAPEAFRAITCRAVRPEDYAEAVERLPWVQRAGGVFRWTGSWLTAFATADPRGAVTLTEEQETQLFQQLDRFRQAGREAFGLDPRYANLDLEIGLCVAPSAYRGEVKERVLAALLGTKGVRPRVGFFSADNFTFGTPLERSRLEAAIQGVEGVRAVEGMRIRRRGWFDWRPFGELVYSVADDEVLRLENDPLFPERGSLRLILEGGA